MMEDRSICQAILTGHLDRIPPLPANTVKIYVCSNAGEFEKERKLLWMEVLPEIQHHSLQYGLDALFVDVLLGNDSVCSTDDLELQMEELETCFEHSLGPFFLCLVGENYGSPPLPTSLEESLFLYFCEHCKANENDIALLRAWYKKDDNAVPPAYQLKTAFCDNCDEGISGTVATNLLTIMQSAALSNPRDGKMGSVKRIDRFFVSGFERVVKKAMKLCPERCIFVFPQVKNAELRNRRDQSPKHHKPQKNGKSISTTKAAYTLVKSIAQVDFKQTMDILTDEILQMVPMTNIVEVLEAYNEGGGSQKAKTHQENYFENFIAIITTKLTSEINMHAAKSHRIPESPARSFSYHETLVHLQHCANFFNTSTTSEFESLAKLQSLLINGTKTYHQLTILKCSEGYEKSLIIAKMCYRVRELFGNDAISIPIFVGLTAKTCLIEDIFRGICVHINMILKQELDIETYSLPKLTNYFHGLLNRISKTSKHLLIAIDGLEHLLTSSAVLDNQQVDWLATKLPPKFHILVSCSGSASLPIIKRLESKLVNQDVIVRSMKMTEEECTVLLNQTLSISKRKLSAEQYNAVLTAVSKEKSPLIMDGIVKTVKRWSQDTSVQNHSTYLPTSIRSVILSKLELLENSFGKIITAHVCRYVTLARYGLTEAELLDILSANDDILLACYKDRTPDILRFPGWLWVKMKRELAPLLSRRQIGGKTLLMWSYRCCSTIMRQKYLVDAESAPKAHGDIADMFLECWPSHNPFLGPDEMMRNTGDRLLSPQPLLYSERKYNTRRIQELWYHLLKAGEVDKLKEHTFCNFEYLLAMADADRPHKISQNLEVIKTCLVDADMHVLHLTMQNAGDSLHSAPIQLANELIGRLRQIKDYFPKYIDSLVTQCMEWYDSLTLPIVVPLTSWLDNIHKPHVAAMKNVSGISCAELLPNGQHIILSKENKIVMYHIASERHVKSFHGHSGHVTCICLSHSKRMFVSGSKDKTVCVWDISLEICQRRSEKFKSTVSCLAMTYNDEHVVCGTDAGNIKIVDIHTGETSVSLQMHTKKVTALKFCSTDTILISGSLDSKIALWYTADWNAMSIIDDTILGPVTSLAVSSDSTFVIAGCSNGPLHIIAVATGTIAQQIRGHQGHITSICICADCHHCVAASSSSHVYLYNFRTGEVLDVYRGHPTPVHTALLTEDEQLAVTVSANEVNVWSLQKRYTKETYQDIHSGPINCISITSDSKRLITGSQDGLLKSWNLDISDFGDNFVGHNGPVTCLAQSSDHSFIVTGSSDATVKVWSLVIATVITNYKGHEREVCGVYVLPDNRLVLSLETAQKIHLWRAEDGQTMRLYASPVQMHSLARSGLYCVCGGGDARLQIWSLADGSIVKEISHTDKITCLAISNDSQFLLTGSLDKSVKVWEMSSGKIIQVVVEPNSAVRCLAITNNNETILTGEDNGAMLVCSLSLGLADRKLVGHTTTVTVIKLTADNSVAISGSADSTIRVWNYRRGTLTTMIDMHYHVLDLVMTDTADRIGVRLLDNNHIPILCLHNSPSKATLVTVASDGGSQNTVTPFKVGSQVEMSEISDTYSLPIKPKAPSRPRVSVVYPLPTASRVRRVSDWSSIPHIMQHSPMRAPIQTTVQAQEKRRIKFPLRRKQNKPKTKLDNVESRSSNICVIV